MILFCTCFLLAIAPTVIESDKASYDGQEMQLSGHVHLEHDFGELSAGFASITKDPSSSKEFQKIHLENEVIFTFPSGSILSCDALDVNMVHGNIELKSSAQSPLVSFDGCLQNKALKMQSPKIDILFKKSDVSQKPRDGKQLPDFIEKIEAFSPVTAAYQGDLHLFANSAVYDNNTALLSFFPKISTENESQQNLCQDLYCRVLFEKTSEILSKRIDINQNTHHIIFEEPQGTLTSVAKDAPLNFTSKTLDWDESKNCLTLRNEVEIQYLQNTIKNDQEVLLLLDDSSKSNSLHKIKSVGTTHMSHEQEFTIICDGTVTADYKASSIALEATLPAQVTYKDHAGVLKADRILVDYAQMNGKMILSKMTFMGNVSSVNNAPFDQAETDEVQRYAMADLVYYFPEKRELILKSNPGKKVLFYDGIKKIRISADEILIDKNSPNQKEHIKTKGRVRMVFDEKETRLFKQKFALEDNL